MCSVVGPGNRQCGCRGLQVVSRHVAWHLRQGAHTDSVHNDVVDWDVVDDTTYYYALSAFDAAGNEGPKSPEKNVRVVALTPVPNTTPPATPTGLSATGGNGQISLTWTPNTESDIYGYNIYRDGVKLNHFPFYSASYVDNSRVSGQTLSYTIDAVDWDQLQSAPSAPVAATTLGTLEPLDGTFESGVDGARLASPWEVHYPWEDVSLAPAACRVRLDACAWGWTFGVDPRGTGMLQIYVGAQEHASKGMSSDGAEVRFWVYCDTTTHYRLLEDSASTTTIKRRTCY